LSRILSQPTWHRSLPDIVFPVIFVSYRSNGIGTAIKRPLHLVPLPGLRLQDNLQSVAESVRRGHITQGQKGATIARSRLPKPSRNYCILMGANEDHEGMRAGPLKCIRSGNARENA